MEGRGGTPGTDGEAEGGKVGGEGRRGLPRRDCWQEGLARRPRRVLGGAYSSPSVSVAVEMVAIVSSPTLPVVAIYSTGEAASFSRVIL